MTDTRRPESVVALRYMARFSCVGGECVDTCCAGWRVLVDRPHYERLRTTLGASPAEAADFDARFVLMPAQHRNSQSHAFLQMRASDGACVYFDEKRLCGLQTAHGPELLPDVCAIYPRVWNAVGSRAELSGKASCPEVARLLLFADDATDLVEPPAQALAQARDQGAGSLHGHAAEVADLVRGALYELAGGERYPLSSRLVFLAATALRLAPLWKRPRLDVKKLAAALEELRQPESLQLLHEAAAPHLVPTSFALESVIRALGLRGEQPRHHAYRGFLAAIVASLVERGEGAAVVVPGGHTIDPVRLLPVYEARRAALRERFDGDLDRATRNYLRHAALTEGLAASGSQFVAVTLSLLMRAAMQQFFLVFHPETDAAVQAGNVAAVRGIQQQSLYILARGLEHTPQLVKLYRATVAERIRNLGEAAALAALV